MSPKPTPPHRLRRWKKILSRLGPGLITGASDDDPSGIATYSQVGAQFGFGMLWTALFSFPLMVSIQRISARIGCVTGHGIAGNLRQYYPRWLLRGSVLLLVTANVLNLGADLGAMGGALHLVMAGPTLLYIVAMGILSLVLEITLPYSQYANILKWLTLGLFAYVVVVFIVDVPWRQALFATVMPTFSLGKEYITGFVAVMGTTISPYLFFWQASEEVEEKEKHHDPALKEGSRLGTAEMQRIDVDTAIGMGFSNVITYFIILTAAVTLHAHGLTQIATAEDAAAALAPIAGPFARLLFALGIIGTGMLAVPILSGSAAYAVGEAMHWTVGLERKPGEAKGFYGVMAVSVLLGIGFNLLHIDPIRALFWVAVLNGVLAVPLMVLLMLMGSNRKIMGRYTTPPLLQFGGWVTTLVMLLAAIGMAVTSWG